MSLADLRKEYQRAGLLEVDLDPDPFRQFEHWFADARDADVPEPSAMTLATVGAAGRPSARVVLLKGVDEDGFSFFTNYDSHKGQQLAVNPYAALVFFWPHLERQVRITGTVEQLTREASKQYFHSRPVSSQLGAWASQQSQVVSGREALDARLAALDAKYSGREVPLPPYWGGYRVRPDGFEFWQGRPNRLHDRLAYSVAADGWRIDRLSP